MYIKFMYLITFLHSNGIDQYLKMLLLLNFLIKDLNETNILPQNSTSNQIHTLLKNTGVQTLHKNYINIILKMQ